MLWMRNVLLALSILFTFSCSEKQEAIYPSHQSLCESVYSSVTIEPIGFYKVYVTAPGIIDEIYKKEGDILVKGDTILTIVNDPANYQQQNAALELALVKDNYQGTSNVIQELENELKLAKLRFKNDSLNFERQKRLWDQNIGSQNDWEQRKLVFQASQNQVQTIQDQIDRKEEELKTQVLKAENNYGVNRFHNEEHVVRSKMDGKLYELVKEKGESVNGQEPLGYVGSHSDFLIKMQVDEVDIVNIREGQTAWISLDAYKKEIFESKVKRIIPKMDDKTQTFWVEAVFTNPPKVLYSGLRGEANIIIQEKDKALVIPIAYLNENNEVKTENGYQKVEIGLKSLEKVEVLEGLDSNTRILKP